jgi:hypothetical protein
MGSAAKRKACWKVFSVELLLLFPVGFWAQSAILAAAVLRKNRLNLSLGLCKNSIVHLLCY